jgi:hypothetical protein
MCSVIATAGHRQFGTRRQLGRTLGSRRGARPTPVCTSICTTCGQVGGFTPVDMWRRRGTPGRHLPAPPWPPAATAHTGCGQEKVTNKFGEPHHVSHAPTLRTSFRARGRRTTGPSDGRKPQGRRQLPAGDRRCRHGDSGQPAGWAAPPGALTGPARVHSVHRRREGRRTGVRRPSWALLVRSVSWGRPRSSAGS